MAAPPKFLAMATAASAALPGDGDGSFAALPGDGDGNFAVPPGGGGGNDDTVSSRSLASLVRDWANRHRSAVASSIMACGIVSLLLTFDSEPSGSKGSGTAERSTGRSSSKLQTAHPAPVGISLPPAVAKPPALFASPGVAEDATNAFERSARPAIKRLEQARPNGATKPKTVSRRKLQQPSTRLAAPKQAAAESAKPARTPEPPEPAEEGVVDVRIDGVTIAAQPDEESTSDARNVAPPSMEKGQVGNTPIAEGFDE